MDGYDQSIAVELTTDQLLLVLASLTTVLTECNLWVKTHEEDSEERDEVAQTKKELEGVFTVFDKARQRLENSWNRK